MRLRRISALVLAAAVATTMLTGCPWDKEEESGSSSSSSSSSSSRPSYDDDDEDDGRPDKPDKPEGPDEPEEPDAPDITLGEGATIVSQTYDKESNSFTVVFSVASKDGYQITSVTVTIDGTAQTLTPGEDGNYTFSLPAGAESCAINVTYEDLGYTLSEDGSTYEVSSAKGLLAWAQDSSKNCTLMQDVDLTGASWSPVSAFSGEFDGQGYTITGLTSALFDSVESGGMVRDVALEVQIAGTQRRAGGVVRDYNAGTVMNCTVSGNISNSSYYAGGIVCNNEGTVIGCAVDGDIQASGGADAGGGTSGGAGGIVGNNSGSIVGCCFIGNVQAREGVRAGGITGINYRNGSITSCYWSNPDDGVGNNYNDSANAVTGERVSNDWNAAIAAMNAQLTGCEYEFALGSDGKPELVQKGSAKQAAAQLLKHFKK